MSWLDKARRNIPNHLRDLLGRAVTDRTAPVALFLGAGLGRYAEPTPLPTGEELRRQAFDRLSLPYDTNVSLDQVLSYLKQVEGRAGVIALIDQCLSGRRWTSTYALLAQVPFPSVWTTNWDTLFADAARACGYRIRPITREENIPLIFHQAENRRDQIILFQPHGSIDDPNQIVATTGDYIDRGGPLCGWEARFDYLFQNYTVVFVGYSLSDINTKASYLSAFYKHRREAPMSYLVQPDPGPHAVEYWKRHNLQVISATANELAVGLTLCRGADLSNDETWVHIVAAHDRSTASDARKRIARIQDEHGYTTWREAAEKACRS